MVFRLHFLSQAQLTIVAYERVVAVRRPMQYRTRNHMYVDV